MKRVNLTMNSGMIILILISSIPIKSEGIKWERKNENDVYTADSTLSIAFHLNNNNINNIETCIWHFKCLTWIILDHHHLHHPQVIIIMKKKKGIKRNENKKTKTKTRKIKEIRKNKPKWNFTTQIIITIWW